MDSDDGKELGRDEAREADATKHEVEHAVPAHGGGLGCTDGEALRRIRALPFIARSAKLLTNE